ncbi:hypothetical protein LXA43DRAFT_245110 [Ganoderma leucocontextum]|nr:hypothetical protein LXA43DRAFT_245110 [Ganoderma leucocontextum]
MKGLTSETTSPDGPTLLAEPIDNRGVPSDADQGRQMFRQADSNRLFAFWRQKFTERSGRDRHVAGSVGVGQLKCDSAVGGNEVNKPSRPHKLRALVTSMSSWTSRGVGRGSARHSPPPASINTASLQPEVTILRPPAPSAASPSPSSDVFHASAVPAPPSPEAHQKPAQPTASASSSTNVYPTFGTFLENVALAQSGAVVPTAETDAASIDSSRSSVRRCPTKASPTSPLSGRYQCNEPTCILAIRRIKEIHRLQRAFANAYAADWHSSMALRQALTAAHLVLLECEQRRRMAATREIATMLQQMGSPNNPGPLVALHALYRRYGLESILPVLPVTGTNTGPQQHMHAGGDTARWGGM